MKPFDLKKALAGDPVVLSNGKKVTAIAHFPNAHNKYRVVAEIEGILRTFTEEGQEIDQYHSTNVLCMAPIQKEVWINLYSNEYSVTGVRSGGATYRTEAEARHGAYEVGTTTPSANYLGSQKITVEV